MNLTINQIKHQTPSFQPKKLQIHTAKPLKNQTSLEKYSLAETMGRAQVSFGSLREVNSSAIIKSETISNGLFKAKTKTIETTKYDKVTGNLTYTLTDENGEIIESFDSNPAKQTSLHKKRNSLGGIDTKYEIGNDFYEIKKTDGKNREFYCEKKDSDIGLWQITTRDFDKRKREIIRTKKEGQKDQVRVIDLKNGIEVTSGPLVYDDKKEELEHKLYSITTTNIITDEEVIYREFDKNNRLVYLEEFSQDGKHTLTRKAFRDKKTDYLFERVYDEFGKTKKLTKTSPDGLETTTIEYEKNSTREKSKIYQAFNYNSEGKKVLSYEEIFIPNTDKLSESSEFNIESENINHPELIKNTRFYLDGKTPQETYKYSKQGVQVTKFANNGYPQVDSYFDKKDFEYRRKVYDTKYNNGLRFDVNINPQNRTLSSKEYKVKNGNRVLHLEAVYKIIGELQDINALNDEDIKINTQTFYEDDGKTPSKIREYDKKYGAYCERLFKNGEEIGYNYVDENDFITYRYRYHQDDTANNYNNRQRRYNYDNYFSDFDLGKEKPKESDEVFLNKLLSKTQEFNGSISQVNNLKLSKFESMVTDEERQRVAQIFGLENIEQTKDLSTLRKLQAKAFPDLNPDDPLAELKFKVIHTFFNAYKNAKA